MKKQIAITMEERKIEELKRRAKNSDLTVSSLIKSKLFDEYSKNQSEDIAD